MGMKKMLVTVDWTGKFQCHDLLNIHTILFLTFKNSIISWLISLLQYVIFAMENEALISLKGNTIQLGFLIFLIFFFFKTSFFFIAWINAALLLVNNSLLARWSTFTQAFQAQGDLDSEHLEGWSPGGWSSRRVRAACPGDWGQSSSQAELTDPQPFDWQSLGQVLLRALAPVLCICVCTCGCVGQICTGLLRVVTIPSPICGNLVCKVISAASFQWKPWRSFPPLKKYLCLLFN